MRVILSVGGGGKGSENFATVAHSRSRLDNFVRSARALVDQFGLDGIDGEPLILRRGEALLKTHYS